MYSSLRTRLTALGTIALSLGAAICLYGGSAAIASADTVPVYDISPTSLSSGTVGSSYTASLTPSANLYPSFHWYVQSGNLPSGVVLDPTTGILSGTPTMAGTAVFTVIVNDSLGHTATRSYALTIQPAAFAIQAPSQLPTIWMGVNWTYDLNIGNASNTYTWTILSGSLPSGLILNPNGVVSGIPNTAGTWMFTVRVMNGDILLMDKAFTLTVAVQNNIAPPVQNSSGPTSNPVFIPGTDQVSLLNNLAALNIPTNSLIRIAYDPSGMNDDTIYYIAGDGKRHAFPTFSIYNSWYSSMTDVRTVDVSTLASIPLGKSVTLHPGSSLIQFGIAPTLYVSQADGSLHRLVDNNAILSVFGDSWSSHITVLSDTIFPNYRLGTDLSSNSGYNALNVQNSVTNPGQVITASP